MDAILILLEFLGCLLLLFFVFGWLFSNLSKLVRHVKGKYFKF